MVCRTKPIQVKQLGGKSGRNKPDPIRKRRAIKKVV
nr:MAG TPA: hypothetical protein [Bacteriophage sp.]